ncbi:homoaconitase large subunit [Methanococcus voltae]|uniref:3-isopropylmalate dehydratase large subunit n=2 Tax=Methanococcus voltae TaxID=2188 RepID=A0A8J7RH23_METVO|nr:homoaconitase large subunit [Methanococcus voltae]MBP2172893.1 methanogen homoaconitase large subunit [Methanococcus voltae]MBP2201697.1 methanogen homoaconitase large subunit [Methanococcus voltae]MCS3922485.1 methanogen homoaconitase large subunit [Methanococcus voltae PS]
MTLAEKIISKKMGREVVAGETVEVDVDIAMTHDGTTPLTVKTFEKIADKVWNPEKVVIVFDHNIPANTSKAANMQVLTRNFVNEQGIKNYYKGGEGICHQLLPEKGHVLPNTVIAGGDSHTCTHGAFGAFATGFGATDMGYIYAMGKTWLKVPETIRVEVSGVNERIYGKDIILKTCKEIGRSGATYMALEYGGNAVKNLDMDDRMTLSNMAIEMGGKTGLIEADDTTYEYLALAGVNSSKIAELKKERLTSDYYDEKIQNDAYHGVLEFDITDMEEQVACPHHPDNVTDVSNIKGLEINQVFIGSCTNGKINDLRVAAKYLKNNEVHRNVRLIVIPASKAIFNQAIAEGLINTFVDAGAMICTPGCGPCLGAHQGVLGDGEVALSTTNRNFKGRMGNLNSDVYLSSPAVAAMSAIKGYITNEHEKY